jgi:hypothetical protein
MVTKNNNKNRIIAFASALFFILGSAFAINTANLNIAEAESTTVTSVENAISASESKAEVHETGTVIAMAPDYTGKTSGLTHQKFTLKLPSGTIVGIDHDISCFYGKISCAPRIDDLQLNDQVEFQGEIILDSDSYTIDGETKQSDVIVHWTHSNKDTDGGYSTHMAGYLKHNGATYDYRDYSADIATK